MSRKKIPSILPKVFRRIGDKLDKVQLQVSQYLQRKSEKLSIRKKKTALIIFCLLFGGYSFSVLIYAFQPKKHAALTVQPIKIPQHTLETGEIPGPPDASISPALCKKITDFRKYMDSLKSAPSGRPLYDSICRARPGLMDSLAVLEKLYQLSK